MRAVVVPEPGDADALTIAERPDPVPAAGEVRIRVTAAGLNGADLSQRRGYYPSPPGAPDWPGLEVSGVVDAVGDGVDAWQVGDRVCALLPGGGYAELVTVDAGLVLPVPDSVDLVEAAGLPEVAATVWSNVFDLGRLAAGEALLVHGGSSGIGTMAIQLGRALGADVIATAGSEEKAAFCREVGAHAAVDYRTQDFVEAARAFTDGRGVDVVLDIVGGAYIARDLDALATGGRILSIAVRDRTPAAVDMGLLMRKRASIHGTTLRARPLAERVAIIAAVRANVWPLLADGRVRPVIDSVFPLEDAAAAHRRMESSTHRGKILLRVG
ncbi:putative NAD(P)H quinone oxidoreductase, PIG3 family [Leifsonia sp. 98AMF]|uniref:NAD(P)H-quinone oxidoreductase n=1 Tax=unclassified Leifsonia TaxID=2663824 RepID=UPI0008793D71|nr:MULTISPECIES: NAD(P)H-quinone oxidoreductase [unclassified Leifsonia]SDH28261.1 putative NAD(P)H quinone oxidoreductase, PIG3 family [Leifsonia sp. 197AMF]SDJ10146.1 putative NAD(P)H quinone oxidoreductase, PIG3 family [Leifsonia sp. 466MF]SDJ60247.1 putative NAD(P)H quinone oxidoreductase, PIG3 family [Leifsonia sp. 157MF]SDN31422.1 putative NAD(P)H quinone oxidoreductase, PIG3 family [Leifsonia sp. 509MF]SEM89954.1 putative NAD(P)H quinone oxidoreductase, PIG3 family [Leifsonia sp. 467MF]